MREIALAVVLMLFAVPAEVHAMEFLRLLFTPQQIELKYEDFNFNNTVDYTESYIAYQSSAITTISFSYNANSGHGKAIITAKFPNKTRYSNSVRDFKVYLTRQSTGDKVATFYNNGVKANNKYAGDLNHYDEFHGPNIYEVRVTYYMDESRHDELVADFEEWNKEAKQFTLEHSTAEPHFRERIYKKGGGNE